MTVTFALVSCCPASIGVTGVHRLVFSIKRLRRDALLSAIVRTRPSEPPAATASVCARARASVTAAPSACCGRAHGVGRGERRAVDLIRARVDRGIDRRARLRSLL